MAKKIQTVPQEIGATQVAEMLAGYASKFDGNGLSVWMCNAYMYSNKYKLLPSGKKAITAFMSEQYYI